MALQVLVMLPDGANAGESNDGGLLRLGVMMVMVTPTAVMIEVVVSLASVPIDICLSSSSSSLSSTMGFFASHEKIKMLT